MDFDPKKNYYEQLGVGEDASKDDIKKAFRKAAVKYHPDKEGGDKQKFQEVNEAYQVLSDDQKKSQYDMFRKGGFTGGMGGGGFDFGSFGGMGGAGFDVDLGDLIGSVFGGGFGGFGGGQTKATMKGADLKNIIEISFDESYLGTTKKVVYERKVKIEGAVDEVCPVCNGKGRVAQQAQTPFGVFQTQKTCQNCGGIGKIYKKDGKILEDGGLQTKKETLEIKIPAGIKDDAYIKYPGKGDEGIGTAEGGDLYLKIRIIPSPKYIRKDNDLYVKSEVTLFDLVLGGEIEVSHPEGKMKIKIPKGTQIGDKIKVGGKGFGEKGIFQKKGDMLIETKVTIPKKLSKDEEKLWKELQKKAE